MTTPFGPGFSYGYDLATRQPPVKAPDAAGPLAVAKTIPAYAATCIMGWGVGNPEVTPGLYNFIDIAQQIQFTETAGAAPIVTLCGAPDWMKGGKAGTTDWTKLLMAPTPDHWEDFATLCAKIATTFPQVKYFVVWKELAGIHASAYTELFNLVTAAVKAVRPDAMVGGPYAAMHSVAAKPKTVTPSGPWGYLSPGSMLNVTYWLDHQVGADFLAVDGRSFTNDAGLACGALESTEKYADVSRWIRSQSDLPIAWMESHLLPDPSVYSLQSQAAFRVAALIHMAGAGVSLGMQWEPEETSGGWDEGLWAPNTPTATPTPLAAVLPKVLKVLAQPVTVTHPGPAVMAQNDIGTIYVSPTAGVTVS